MRGNRNKARATDGSRNKGSGRREDHTGLLCVPQMCQVPPYLKIFAPAFSAWSSGPSYLLVARGSCKAR